MVHPDAWLFLPPEVEALVPSLVARLETAWGREPDPLREQRERERIETLVLEGDMEEWRVYLRAAAAKLARYDGPDTGARAMLAAILDDQFILARAVVDLEPPDDAARQQLAGLADE